jgi:hypothetical protein
LRVLLAADGPLQLGHALFEFAGFHGPEAHLAQVCKAVRDPNVELAAPHGLGRLAEQM